MRIMSIHVLIHYMYTILVLICSVKMQFQGALRNCGASDMGSTATHLKDTSQFLFNEVSTRMQASRFEQQTSFSQSDIHWQIFKSTTASSNHGGRARIGLVASAPEQMCGVSQWCFSHSPANLLQFGHFYMKPFPQMWYAFVMLCDID